MKFGISAINRQPTPLTTASPCRFIQSITDVRKADKDRMIDKDRALHLEDLRILQNSMVDSNARMTSTDQQIAETLKKMQALRDEAENAGATANTQRLLSLLETLKVLEKQEAEVESNYSEECSKLQLEVIELEDMIQSNDLGGSSARGVDNLVANAVERLNLAKTDIASKLREITSLKRQRDDVPTQAELIQYERRFSELNVHIQGKLRQTRKYYATYNALLEIKELMLKETSLLNSMSSQFHDALNTPAGRATLTSSMDGISRSIQQKLQNVRLSLQAEQKASEALKKKHAAANLEKRRCYSLLKAFQEECTRNERLRNQTPEIHLNVTA